eukprot:12684104-Heterocapsa_arctica.AAC.1
MSDQENLSTKGNVKERVRTTNKALDTQWHSKVRKYSDFKGNGQKWPGLTLWLATEPANDTERLDKNPVQDKEDKYPGVSSQTRVRLRA